MPKPLECVVKSALAGYSGSGGGCEFSEYLDERSRGVWSYLRPSWDRLVAVLHNNIYVVLLIRNAKSACIDIYIFGLQGSGKLFMHAFTCRPPSLSWIADVVEEYARSGNPVVREVGVDAVRGYLGFTYDAEFDREVDRYINAAVWRGVEAVVRVQGDLVMHVYPRTVYEYVARLAAGQLTDILIKYCISRITEELDSLGINYTVAEIDDMIDIPLVGDSDELLRKLVDYLGEKVPGCGMFARNGRIEVTSVSRAGLYDEVMHEIVKRFEELKGEYELRIGRHVIKYVGWPRDVLIALNSSVGRVAVYLSDEPNTILAEEVTITHPEHPPFHMKFAKTVTLTFTFVDNGSEDVENTITLQKLFSKT